MRWVVGERRGKEGRDEEERGNIFPSGGGCAGVCWGVGVRGVAWSVGQGLHLMQP